MIKFEGRILQFGFGAVGKSFYEKIQKEIRFDENNYYVITGNPSEFDAYINLGGIAPNFLVKEITKENYADVFGEYLQEGDLLIDFADMVGTKDFCDWCAGNNIMYLNTGEADWPNHWYSIFSANELKHELIQKYSGTATNRYPIVIHHGNNPGLVSHFVKAAIEYVVRTQFKKDKILKELIKTGKFNEAARILGVRMIHVNDIDSQEVKEEYSNDKLCSTWCMESFWFEMLSEATIHIGTHEKVDYADECNYVNREKGYLEFKKIAAERKCRTYYPGGGFGGYLVPHEEIVSIAKNLEVKEGDKVVYRPTVMFVYLPCPHARNYIEHAKVNEYPVPDPDKPQDCEDENSINIIHGYIYPEKYELVYQEKIESGTEFVGILLLGDNFNPVWVGNRIEPSFLYKNKKDSYWQTPTITPVAMSALAAVCWMIKNKNKGGIYFPDDIPEYNQIIKTAEKYISKTIYHTFTKEEIEKSMGVDFDNIQAKDIFLWKEDKV